MLSRILASAAVLERAIGVEAGIAIPFFNGLCLCIARGCCVIGFCEAGRNDVPRAARAKMRYTQIGKTHLRVNGPAKAGVTCMHGGLPGDPSNASHRDQRAGRQTANTHVRKDTPGRHPGRLQVANLKPSKRCSCMPLIGLVRLRWALEGAIPFFDPISATGAVA